MSVPAEVAHRRLQTSAALVAAFGITTLYAADAFAAEARDAPAASQSSGVSGDRPGSASTDIHNRRSA